MTGVLASQQIETMIAEGAIREFLAGRLARFKIPRSYEFRAALLAFDPIDHHFHTTHSRIPSFSLD